MLLSLRTLFRALLHLDRRVVLPLGLSVAACSEAVTQAETDAGEMAVATAAPGERSDAGAFDVACGNGKLEHGEQCDDHDRKGDDGCSSTCQLEPLCQDGELLRDGECFAFVSGDDAAIGCGNGIIELDEQCDDGNHAANDGCGAFCRREPRCGNGELEREEECDPPGTPVCGSECQWATVEPTCGDGVQEGIEECDDGNLRNGDECTSRCLANASCGNGEVERGEECEPPNKGSCDESCHLPAAPECGNGELESYVLELGDVTIPIVEECDDGNTIDGDECSGNCVVTVMPEEPGCGNGVVEDEIDELCDDGNLRNGDGCNSHCEPEECGDGIKQSGEECDDGNLRNNDGCSSACVRDARCGDGVKEGAEECDDGNTVDGDRCTARCFREPIVSHHCGNGQVDPGETCDDGNRENGDKCSVLCDDNECGDGVKSGGEECDDTLNEAIYSWTGLDCAFECRLPGYCGDGDRQYGYEECDDGNRLTGDGCSEVCERETVCGNNILEFGEQCDDGNLVPGDDCSLTCFLEPSLQCGDNLLDTEDGEECDDGNFVPGDGCSPTCHHEECGNGFLDPREECEAQVSDADAGTSTTVLPCTELCQFELFCGDGIVSPGEECDHEVADATCTETCATPASCGDGFVDSSEQCDDHNTAVLDGCSASCQNEPACGDGTVDSGEECDDGNVQNGDPCSSKCRVVGASGGGGSGDASTLRNGSFATNVTGWAASDANVTLSHNSQDVGNVATSGSLSVSFSLNTGSGALNTVGAQQCISVLPNTNYVLSASALIGTTQPASTRSGMLLRFFASGDCSGSATASNALSSSDQRGLWTPVGGAFSTPAGVGSMLLRLKVSKAGTDPLAVVLYDQVTLTGGTAGGGGGSTPTPVCGDGQINVSAEQCDDGNLVAGDGCSATCSNEPVCGDGILAPGEPCDDGNRLNGDACSATCQVAPVCGDRTTSGPEQCDDGNRVNGDGCSRLCQTELTCGDGNLIAGSEQCDDRNTVSGDGCSSHCKLEPTCGDGHLTGDEECDDSNLINDDGCNQLCGIERACPADPVDPECINSCGDGIVQASLGETCEYAPGTSGNLRCRANCQQTCDACLEHECWGHDTGAVGYPVEQCLQATGVAEAGPGKGRPRAELCRDLFDCLNEPRATDRCDTEGQLASLMPCFAQCADALAAVAETDSDSLQRERVFNPEFALGAGFDLFRCAVTNCDDACLVECGNAMIEGAEECDDGNTNSLDACDHCQSVSCGDGRRNGAELCDPKAPGDETRCNDDCTLKLGCGDGTLQVEAPDGGAEGFVPEECDDKNVVSGDGCSSTCQFEYCGDGVLQSDLEIRIWDGQGTPPVLDFEGPTEECDGAPVNGVACTPECTLVFTCEQCTQSRCGAELPTACSDGDPACDLPAVNDMLACFAESGCAREALTDPAAVDLTTLACFCGDIDAIECFSTPIVELSGECTNEVRSAFKPNATNSGSIELNWHNVDKNTAAKINLYYLCQFNSCTAECDYD